jgi:hypothetical protein
LLSVDPPNRPVDWKDGKQKNLNHTGRYNKIIKIALMKGIRDVFE